MKTTRSYTPRPSRETERERTIFAISMIIGVLKFNPEAGLAAKCRDARVAPTLIDELVEMKALTQIENKTGSRNRHGLRRLYKWTGEATAEAAFEKLILARRAKEEARKQAEAKAAAEAAAKTAAKAPGANAAEMAALRAEFQRLATRVAGLGEEVKTLVLTPKTATLSKDDSDMLNLILADNARLAESNKAMANTIANLEAQVGELARGLFAQAGKPAAAAAKEAPAPRLKLGVIGIHERDHQHLLDSLAKRLGPQAAAVEIVFIDHTPGRVDIPTTLSAVIVTENGHKRGMEAQRLYPKRTHYIRGTGISAVANQVATLSASFAPGIAA